jgi:hypothetical protein
VAGGCESGGTCDGRLDVGERASRPGRGEFRGANGVGLEEGKGCRGAGVPECGGAGWDWHAGCAWHCEGGTEKWVGVRGKWGGALCVVRCVFWRAGQQAM